jgi:hypothetical protein
MIIMKKIFLSLSIFLVVALLMPVSVGFARSNDLNTHDAGVLRAEGDTFSFAELKEEDHRLFGPFATETLFFGLPANWKLTGGAQLELDYSVSIQTAVSSAENQLSGGTLSVLMNDQVVAVLPLEQSGRFTQFIQIPLTALSALRRDGRQELSIILSSSESCVIDAKMDVIIHSSSRFIIPHEVTAPNTDLKLFPRPLYQDTIFTDSALIVVPDEPTSSELQAALTVSAGLQARTGGAMAISVMNHDGLNDTLLAGSHLILVGNAASLPIFYQLATPLALVNGVYEGAGDAGILQMIPSPWSPERVVLIISGNDDQATVKAAQALSTGVIRPNTASNLALIDSVNNRVYAEQSAVNQTLENLGYESTTFEGRGESNETFQFFIPTGQTVTAEAYFEVSLSNSTLLNYARSGVFIILNEKPIGSIRLSDETANKANNRIQIAIPPSAVRSGVNFLDVVVALEPLDECADPNQTGLFVTLWADSRLYLPLAPSPVSTVDIPDLSTYPLPFVQSPDLGKVAFVLERNNLDAWSSAIKVAGQLGTVADGVIFTPIVMFADETAGKDLSTYDIMVVGTPSKMDFINEINPNLPAPFAPGSDMASEEELQVVYQIDPNQPVGYLELLPSPFNPENLIVAVVGNSSQGLTWSADALLDEVARQALIGNFAVIRDDQILSVDTRLLVSQGEVSPPSPVNTPIASNGPAAAVNVPPLAITAWVPMAIMIIIGLIIAVVVILFISNKRKRD